MARHYKPENREKVLFYGKSDDEARIVKWLMKMMGGGRIQNITLLAANGRYQQSFLAFSEFLLDQLKYMGSDGDRLSYIIENNMMEYGDSLITEFLYRKVIGQPFRDETGKRMRQSPGKEMALADAISAVQIEKSKIGRNEQRERFFIVPDKEGNNTRAVVRTYTRYDKFIIRLYSPSRRKWVKVPPRVRKELRI